MTEEIREQHGELTFHMKPTAEHSYEFRHNIGDRVKWKGIVCRVVGCWWDGEKEMIRIVRFEPPDEYIDIKELDSCL